MGNRIAPKYPNTPPKFENKQTTRDACAIRYGHIDMATLSWPDAATWIKAFHVSPGMFPNWKVLNTQMPVKAISANIDIHAPLKKALDALFRANLADQLRTFDGCFNIRAVRGRPDDVSAHSWGLAVDINAQTNPLSSILHTDMSPAFVRCFTDQGFAWGGNFLNRKDPMHFSYCWEG